DELKNPVTCTSYAAFEPSLEYIVSNIPRVPFDNFEKGEREPGTQMKATGVVMSIGRTYEDSLLKAFRSLAYGVHHHALPSGEPFVFEHITALIHA
ncbi:hypothetical protein DV965_14290, partial [Staphylococcus pseudintermedius]|uniref:hypothetical protein n=1 Tax=Staphylococcus pseudintermedius TaxID=283734 RepID=UPI000E39BA1C